MNHTNKPDRQLNQNQLDILNLIYRHRFATTSLLSQSLANRTGILLRLGTLAKHGYVDRHFDASYRLRGKHASYYLTPKGLRVLKDRTSNADITEKIIKNSYKDKTARKQFINHNLTIYTLHNILAECYPKFRIQTW